MNLLERLKQLEAEATPGPWTSHETFGNGYVHCEEAGRIAELYVTGICDAKLIAEMRNALPKLLAVVEAAKAIQEDADLTYGPDRALADALAALEEGV